MPNTIKDFRYITKYESNILTFVKVGYNGIINFNKLISGSVTCLKSLFGCNILILCQKIVKLHQHVNYRVTLRFY